MTFAPVSGTTSADAAGNQSSTTKTSASPAIGKDAFLQLLVAQIKNQNPLNPADGVQFLSQLAQFSQLEQTMGIKEGIDGLRTQVDSITTVLNNAQTQTEGDKNV
jgi:flagellar basal-body rod modification protein FlgD